jgi:hypothetical protein
VRSSEISSYLYQNHHIFLANLRSIKRAMHKTFYAPIRSAPLTPRWEDVHFELNPCDKGPQKAQLAGQFPTTRHCLHINEETSCGRRMAKHATLLVQLTGIMILPICLFYRLAHSRLAAGVGLAIIELDPPPIVLPLSPRLSNNLCRRGLSSGGNKAQSHNNNKKLNKICLQSS